VLYHIAITSANRGGCLHIRARSDLVCVQMVLYQGGVFYSVLYGSVLKSVSIDATIVLVMLLLNHSNRNAASHGNQIIGNTLITALSPSRSSWTQMRAVMQRSGY
jgi:hypothetical protein